jgi:hypothetical protein
VLAIVAAPTLEESPTHTCFAAVLPGDAPVTWRCNLHGKRVIVAAAVYHWPTTNALDLVGVADGEVKRIELEGDVLYERGKTWGEFSAARDGAGHLRVVGRDGSARAFDVVPGVVVPTPSRDAVATPGSQHRYPHCLQPLAIISVVIPADAAVVSVPEPPMTPR